MVMFWRYACLVSSGWSSHLKFWFDHPPCSRVFPVVDQMRTIFLVAVVGISAVQAQSLSQEWSEVSSKSVTGGSPFDAHAVDMDADGDIDVLLHVFTGPSSFKTSAMIWLENIGNSTSLGPQHTLAERSEEKAPYVKSLLIDLDGDGDRDLFWITNDHLIWHENVEGSGFAQMPTEQEYTHERFGWTHRDCFDIQWAGAADMDSDGNNDIVVATEAGQISYFPNNGSGHFGSQTLIVNVSTHGKGERATADASYINVQLVDFNSDGAVDIGVTANDRASTRIDWFANPADSTNATNWTRTEVVIANRTYLTLGVIVHDVDGDGYLDIVNSRFGRETSWLRGLNSGWHRLGKQHTDFRRPLRLSSQLLSNG